MIKKCAIFLREKTQKLFLNFKNLIRDLIVRNSEKIPMKTPMMMIQVHSNKSAVATAVSVGAALDM